MQKIKAGVIGLGNMGRHHVHKLASLENVNLVGICDTNYEHVQEKAKTYGCNGYTNIDEFLSEPLDAVCVVVPTRAHFEISKKILEKNIHILIEKPITETIQQAETLIQIAKEKNRTLMIGHIEQFNPAIIQLCTYLENNVIGTPQSLISRRVGPQPHQIKDAGVIIDLAVHDIGIQTHIMQKQPKNIHCMKKQVRLDNHEDRAEFFLDFGCSSGYIQVNWLSPIPIRTLHVTGEKGIIDLDLGKKTISLITMDGKETKTDLSHQDALELELKAFIDAIQHNTQPIVSGDDGLKTLKIALKGFQSTP